MTRVLITIHVHPYVHPHMYMSYFDYEERGRECSHVTMLIMKGEEGRENFHIQ